MRKVVSRWVAHQLTDEQNQKDFEFVVKIYRNLGTEYGDYVTLSPVMRRGFITDRLIGSQAILPALVKMNHQRPLFVGIDINLKHFSVYSLNPLVLSLYIK